MLTRHDAHKDWIHPKTAAQNSGCTQSWMHTKLDAKKMTEKNRVKSYIRKNWIKKNDSKNKCKSYMRKKRF